MEINIEEYLQKKIIDLEKKLDQKEKLIKLLTENSIKEINKRSEEEALNSDQMLQVILDNIPQSVFWKDKESNYIGGSRSFAKDAGFKDPFELLGKTDFDMPWRHSAERFRNEDKQIYTGKVSKINYEEKINLPDGSRLWIRMSKSPLYDTENKVMGLIGVLENITQEKLSIEALSESEIKYRTLFDNSTDGLFILNSSNRFILINKKFNILSGYSPEEILNLELKDIFQTDEGIIIEELLANLEENDITELESFIKASSGSGFPVEITIKKVNKNWIQGIARDISGRKKAEQRITQQATILDAIGQAVITVDLNSVIIYWNMAAEKLYGWKKEEVIGKNINNIVPFYFEQMSNTEDEDIFNRTLEFKVQSKNGSKFLVGAVLSPLLNEHNQHIGTISISSDITKRKYLIDELKAAKEKAECMNNLKTIFLANMSHELRTPMSGLLGYCELLLSEVVNPDHLEMIENMTLSSKRLLNTLNMILNYSLIESNTIQMKEELFNLSDEIRREIKSFLQAANQKGLYLDYVTNDNELCIRTDKDAIKSIIGNIINNSIKFTEKGGITINCYKETSGKIPMVVISVKDTGIGIPEKDHNKIFEEFRQVSEGMSRNFDGTGLGLTITKRLVEKMNGEISFESKENAGTIFYLKFPLHNT